MCTGGHLVKNHHQLKIKQTNTYYWQSLSLLCYTIVGLSPNLSSPKHPHQYTFLRFRIWTRQFRHELYWKSLSSGAPKCPRPASRAPYLKNILTHQATNYLVAVWLSMHLPYVRICVRHLYWPLAIKLALKWKEIPNNV